MWAIISRLGSSASARRRRRCRDLVPAVKSESRIGAERPRQRRRLDSSENIWSQVARGPIEQKRSYAMGPARRSDPGNRKDVGLARRRREVVLCSNLSSTYIIRVGLLPVGLTQGNSAPRWENERFQQSSTIKTTLAHRNPILCNVIQLNR
ncbi:hypothetical protein VTK26DRAFT_3355 [Humicola hyalothermophila]